MLLGKAFDSTGSYAALVLRLAFFTFVAGVLMLGMPRYLKTHDLDDEWAMPEHTATLAGPTDPDLSPARR